MLVDAPVPDDEEDDIEVCPETIPRVEPPPLPAAAFAVSNLCYIAV